MDASAAPRGRPVDAASPRAAASDAAAPDTPGQLLTRASTGDSQAWDALVERFAPLVWSVARAHRLDVVAAADVSQTVWLRLVEHLDRLREPEAVAGWLATTTRHECLRLLRREGRELPSDDAPQLADRPSDAPGPEELLVLDEQRLLVWRALRTLSARCQALLRALAVSPEASYAEVSAALDMPIGSIGPTRSRCFQHLRKALDAIGAEVVDA
ncbi:MAG: RNA polymerase sigma factor [Motilibacteraceae bacterium]